MKINIGILKPIGNQFVTSPCFFNYKLFISSSHHPNISAKKKGKPKNFTHLIKYTQMNSKVGNLIRRRPEFEPDEVGAEAAKLKNLSFGFIPFVRNKFINYRCLLPKALVLSLRPILRL